LLSAASGRQAFGPSGEYAEGKIILIMSPK
jgi:hypothetical protein